MSLHHTKLQSFWDSHVDALAEVWKMLVTAIEMSETFIFHWCCQHDSLDAACYSNPKRSSEKRSAKRLVTSPQTFKTFQKKMEHQFFWGRGGCHLEICKTSLDTRFCVLYHPLSTNQPPIDQRLGTFGGPIVTSKVSNAFTQFPKFTPLPWQCQSSAKL